MKRSELTVKAMADRGFCPVNPNELRIKDIVFAIRENTWKYLRMTEDEHIFSDTEFGMCSTYEITKKKEYLEYSMDNKVWHKVAYRFVEVSRRCLYAD